MAQIDENVVRDLTVGRNVTIGGNQIVRGNMQVDGGLVVKGWIKAENMNMPTVGVFASESDLNTAYPAPQKPGLIAGVLDTGGDTAKVILYWSQAGSTPWVTTEPTPTYMDVKTILNVTAEGISVDTVAELQGEIDDLDESKADKLAMSGAGAATANNFIAINSDGNIKDSGHKHSDYAAASHTHSDYIPKVNAASEDDIAILTSQGAVTDSGIKKAILNIPVGYFNDIITTQLSLLGTYRGTTDITKYSKCVYFYRNGTTKAFVWREPNTNNYYENWDNKSAYMVDATHIIANKLYVGEGNKIYYVTGDYNDDLALLPTGGDVSGKADKVSGSGLNNKLAALDANGNLKSSGIAASAVITDVSDKADKADMEITTSDGVAHIKVKPSNEEWVYNINQTDFLIAQATNEAVVCEYRLPIVEHETNFVMCTGGLRRGEALAIVNNKIYLPSGSGNIVYTYGPTSSTLVITAKFFFVDFTAIPNGAFLGVDDLAHVYIPSFVRRIGHRTFDKTWTNNDVIDCACITPPFIEEDSFDESVARNALLNVHAAVVQYYAPAENRHWANIATINTFNRVQPIQ